MAEPNEGEFIDGELLDDETDSELEFDDDDDDFGDDDEELDGTCPECGAGPDEECDEDCSERFEDDDDQGDDAQDFDGTLRAAIAGGVCEHCGCSDSRACISRDGQPCHWVRPGLCSACLEV